MKKLTRERMLDNVTKKGKRKEDDLKKIPEIR
jgi:hypothetical protein